MNSEQLFNKWKMVRSNVTAPPDLATRVVQSIKADNASHPFKILDQWMPSTIGRWLTGAAFLMLGLLRMVFVIGHLIGAGSVAP